MPRPKKHRYIGSPPPSTVFKPQGIPMGRLRSVPLSLDELEALRLADLRGNSHEQAAVTMHVSRPTFGRILERAHGAVARALLEGKALVIAGGTVTSSPRCRVRCRKCRRQWEMPVHVAADFHCPRCPDDPHTTKRGTR
jgi:uncharacterized protein